MNKIEFFKELSEKIKSIDKEEINKTLYYYRELIEDMVEDGKTEEEAVASFESTDSIAIDILNEYKESGKTIHSDVFWGNNHATTQTITINHNERKRRLPTWAIVLLSVTAIVWLPLVFALGITAIALVFALVVTAVAVVGSGIIAIFSVPMIFINQSAAAGFLTLGISLAAIGLGIFISIGAYYGIKAIAKAIKNRKGGKKL